MEEREVAEMKCSDCGEVVSADANFCPKCGTRMQLEVIIDPVIQKLIKKGVIAEDEKVLYAVKQKRMYKLIWPGWIIITDVQVIVYTITWFGYNLDAYGYDFFHNLVVRRGLFSSKICFISRLGVAKLRGLPRDAASEAMQAISKGMRARIPIQKEPLRREVGVS